MNQYEIRERGYIGKVWPSSGYAHQFYFYSVSRDAHGERLFDGVAGDIAEAVSSMHAHILFLTSPTDENRDSEESYDDERVDQRVRISARHQPLSRGRLETDLKQLNTSVPKAA